MVIITIPLMAGAMSCARRTWRRFSTTTVTRQWLLSLTLTLWALLLLGTLVGNSAVAQISEGGPQTPPAAGGEAGPPIPGGGVGVTPAIPGPAPETLPPPPGGGFGIPNPAAPPYSVNNEAPTLVSPPTLALLPPRAGVLPLQTYDPTAPAVLIQPTASVGETFTDNVNYVHSPRKFAAITQLSPGVSISADTPRLQAVAAGSLTGAFYLPGSNSRFNQIYGNLYANGFGTIYPDLAFVDFQSVITQGTTLPGFGFQNLSALPSNQQTQQYINSISPYLRKSFDGFVDTELRYRFSSTNYGGFTGVATAPGVPGLNNLTSSTFNEGTLIAATGENFQKALARFTADASQYNSSFFSQNTQVSALNDFEYRFVPNIAALGRIGYQNQRFPGSPAATFAGLTWLAGGQLGTLGPDQPSYLSLQYGKQQGVYGITGSAQLSITPTLFFAASAVQGIASQGQLFQNALASSTYNPSGGIVSGLTGLPIAFYSPGLGLNNNVYRQHIYDAGLTDSIPPNTYSLFLFYNEQQSLTPPITSPTKSLGASLTYSRSMRPYLSGSATLGYVNSTNAQAVAPATSTVSFDTISATLGINYVLGQTLTGSILYTFSYQTNGSVLASGRSGDVFVNQLAFLLSKTF